MMGIIDWIVNGLVGLGVAVFLALCLLYTTVALYTDQECLAQGYPKSVVTIGLDRYCIAPDGSTKSVAIKQ